MGRNIWVIGNDRHEMIEAQRRINSTGGMRAVCKMSFEAVRRAIEERVQIERSMQDWRQAPSLIIVDYMMSKEEEFHTVSYIRKQKDLAGVPGAQRLCFTSRFRRRGSFESSRRRGSMMLRRIMRSFWCSRQIICGNRKRL